jgi:hypothetical protein
MISRTFQANAADLHAIQAEVKRHNLRFVGNPAAWIGKLDRMSVTVEAEDMDAFKAGIAAICRITDTPKPEPAKQSFWRRIFG